MSSICQTIKKDSNEITRVWHLKLSRIECYWTYSVNKCRRCLILKGQAPLLLPWE